jgi:hypothetical protein
VSPARPGVIAPDPRPGMDKEIDHVIPGHDKKGGRVSDLYFHWEVCHGDSTVERRCPWYSFP